MKFQKYLIFNLWVCVTDSPRCIMVHFLIFFNTAFSIMIFGCERSPNKYG